MTVPEAPVPAAGILNVCVEPEDTILNSVPDVPVANVCVAFVKPFNDEIPEPVTLSVIVPVPCVIDRFDPATKVLYSREDEELFMPNIWFAVPDVPSPVPPYARPIVEPFHVPLVITPLPTVRPRIVVEVNTEVPLILYAYPEPRFVSPKTCNLYAGRLKPMPTFPPNSPMETVPFAFVLNTGRPDISLIEKI